MRMDAGILCLDSIPFGSGHGEHAVSCVHGPPCMFAREDLGYGCWLSFDFLGLQAMWSLRD